MLKTIKKHPWILTIYLLGISLAAFMVPSAIRVQVILSLFVLQYLLLVSTKNLDRNSITLYYRLKFLFFFLILCSGLFPDITGAHPIKILSLTFYREGLIAGVIMSMQIALVVLTSYTVRKLGDAESFVRGLRQLHIPVLLSYSLDTTLSLLAGEAGGNRRGMGRGDGSGGGRRGSNSLAPTDENRDESFKAFLRAIRGADLSPLIRKIRTSLDQSRGEIERKGLSADIAHDVSIIAGISVVMLSFKFIKILPGIAYFSGGKAIFFFPLYIVAAELTRSRWGATVAGTVMGILAFLNGDGRYGIFEVFKHVAPGMLLDLLWPIAGKMRLSIWLTCGLGLLAAFARTSTEFLMVIFLSSDSAELYIFPAMRLLPNLIAGFMSGFITLPVVRALRAGELENSEEKQSQSSKKGESDDTDNEDRRGSQAACA